MGIVGAVLQLVLNGFGSLVSDPGSLWSASSAPGLPVPENKTGLFINYGIDARPPDYGVPESTSVLLTHEFAASWGKPYTVPYSAPSHDFTNVELKLEVETFGIQYDRLAHLYINGVEVWRPSTSEPRGKPSYSEYTKDLSVFAPLFNVDGELSFELNNLVTERLNGTFNVTLTASYYSVPSRSGGARISDKENDNQRTNVDGNDDSAPIRVSSSSRTNGTSGTHEWYQHERKPPARIEAVLTSQVATGAVEATVPQVSRNTTRAVLQVFASGNGNDEFWYAESSLDPLDDKTGPARHVIININHDLAGVVAPFQQIYTGGFQPALWSPFVGVKAYDVPSYHIDVTPFLPDLWAADTPVSFVVKDTHHGVVTHEWIISAALLTWEEEGSYGTGSRYPPVAKNHSASVLIPGTEITSFTSEVNVSANLAFEPNPPVRVEWLQEQTTDAVIIGELVVTHSIESSSVLTYHESTYSTSRNYALVLALNESSIEVVQELTTSDVSAPGHSPPLDARNQSVRYNGSWYNFDSKRKHSKNGSEVLVNVHDPWQVDKNGAPTNYHLHATSKDGEAVRLESSSDLRVDRPIADSSPARQWPMSDLTLKQLQKNRDIRHAWLRHGL